VKKSHDHVSLSTQFMSVTDRFTDRQSDRRTDGQSYCGTHSALCCSAQFI